MEPHERLQAARRRAGFESATDAARAFGWNENTYRSHENGERGLKGEVATRYGRAFKVPAGWLLTGEGETPERLNTVGVIGSISAGGTIEVAAEQLSAAEPLFEIEVPFPVPTDAFALRITGDSMWPRYDDGDVIVCHRHSQDPAPLVGWEAAVGTPEGNRYLKRLLRGSRGGLYTLESHNAAPIRDVQVAWASEVFGVVRAARWRRLDDKQKRKAIKHLTP